MFAESGWGQGGSRREQERGGGDRGRRRVGSACQRRPGPGEEQAGAGRSAGEREAAEEAAGDRSGAGRGLAGG